MDLNKMTPDEAKNALALLNQAFNANIMAQQQGSTQEVSQIILDLTQERPSFNAFEVSFPFISMRVEDATDSSATVSMLLNTRDDFQDPITLKLNDTLEIDRGARKVFIYWKAQPNKKVVINFYTTARVRSGSLVLAQNSGTSMINIGRGSASNDGLTLTARVKTGNSGTLPTNASGGRFTILAGINDKSIYNGVGSIGGSGNTDLFKVPSGYKCELIGCEYIVPVATTATSFSVYLLGVPQNYNDTLANLLADFTKRRVYNDFTSTLALNLTPTKLQFLPDYNNVNQLNQMWDENENVVMATVNFDAVNNAGRVEFDLIFRLIKKVGA